MTTRRFHGDGGFSLVEAVAALAVTFIGFAGATLVLVRGVDGSADAAARNRATVITNDVLETAKAYGCGLQVIDEPFLADLAAACGLGAGVADGSVTFTRSSGPTTYQVAFDVMWLPRAAGYTCDTLNLGDPNHLWRTATVSWERNGREKKVTAGAVEAVPGDAARYRSAARRHLVIEDASIVAGDRVRLLANGAPGVPVGAAITRTADAAGCVWFPWLPYQDGMGASSYTYSINGGADNSVAPAWFSGPLEAR